MDDPSVLVAIISAASAVVCGIMVWRSSGRATDVDARAAELTWVREMRQDATDTRRELDQCQEQVRTLSRQLSAVTREVDHWIARYQTVHRAAWRPGVTLDQLREILGPDLPATASDDGPSGTQS